MIASHISIIHEIQNFYLHSFFNSTLFILYMITLFVDVFTGNIVALYQRKWNSRTGINGTLRHIALFCVVALLLPIISYSTNIPTIANGILLYVITQYTVSILENISALGFDFDDSFNNYFEFLGSDKDKNNKQKNKGGKNE